MNENERGKTMTEAIFVKAKHWTYGDYCNLNDDKRYEVIEGELIMTPAPSFKHQKVLAKLGSLIFNYVNEKKLGEVVFSPVDVVLSDDIVLQPDIVYISNENTGIIKEAGIFGPPDMVIEVISPTSIYKDTHVKKRLYEQAGIKEYWLVFPDEKVIEIFALEKGLSLSRSFGISRGRYDLVSTTEKTGKIKSNLLEMELDVKDAF